MGSGRPSKRKAVAAESTGQPALKKPRNIGRRGTGTSQSRLRRPSTPPILTHLLEPPQACRPSLHLYGWGSNGFDALGKIGSEGNISAPIKHPWVSREMEKGTFGDERGAGIVAVAAGGMHTLLLDERGTIWSTGVNDDGALGRKVDDSIDEALEGNHSHIAPESTFGAASSLRQEHYIAVALVAGDSFGGALDTHGQPRMWGTFRASRGSDAGSKMFSLGVTIQDLPVAPPNLGKHGVPTLYAAMAAGDNHVLALTPCGDVYAWGINDFSQLGRRFSERKGRITDGLAPSKVIIGSRRSSRKVVLIGAGGTTSFAVDEIGDVWAWGANDSGQAGVGHASIGQILPEPIQVTTLNRSVLEEKNGGHEERVMQISGGERHTLFLTSRSRILVCGANDDCQLGLVCSEGHTGCVGTPTELSLPQLSTADSVISVACGPRYSMAVTRQGRLFSWGLGQLGELGLGECQTQAMQPTEISLSSDLIRVRHVACGGQHVTALAC